MLKNMHFFHNTLQIKNIIVLCCLTPQPFILIVVECSSNIYVYYAKRLVNRSCQCHRLDTKHLIYGYYISFSFHLIFHSNGERIAFTQPCGRSVKIVINGNSREHGYTRHPSKPNSYIE